MVLVMLGVPVRQQLQKQPAQLPMQVWRLLCGKLSRSSRILQQQLAAAAAVVGLRWGAGQQYQR